MTIIASLIYFQYGLRQLTLLSFCRHTACFEFWISKIQDFRDFELSPMWCVWNKQYKILDLSYKMVPNFWDSFGKEIASFGWILTYCILMTLVPTTVAQWVERQTGDPWIAYSSFIASGVTVLCPWARHFIRCLVLVQAKETHPNMPEKVLTGT